jgi:hypothetical protein
MDNEPEWVLALYRNHKMLDLEHALARDIQQADQYMKDRVKEGMSELEAEDRAVELIPAPKDGPADSENPPKPFPPKLRQEVIDRIEALEEVFAQEVRGNKVVNLPPKN